MTRKRTSGGRVTPKGTQPTSRAPSGRARQHGSKPPKHRPADPEPSARYSPPKQDYVARPLWHKKAGWIGVGLGLLVVVLNDAMLLGDDLLLLPFGHSELYLLLGLAVAGWSTRFLGLFDRETVYV